jgi:hypothetical protein
MIRKLMIQCRIEEVPTIGKFLADSLSINLGDFTAFSPGFDAGYLTTFNTKLATISELINPKQYTAELKVITLRINTNRVSLRPKIDFLEGYIKRATGLTIGVKDFGVSEVRNANNRGDVEGLIEALSYLLTNVGNNMAALEAKGYTPAQHTALGTIKSNLYEDNAAQNAKMNERNNKVVNNYGLINDFWVLCADVSDAGKRIYKSMAANKVDDFTIAALIRRIRQEQKKNKFAGVVKLEGEVIGNAKIEMIPVTEGRRRTTKSDANGKFEIKSLTEGEYIVNISADGAVSESINVVIERGKTTTGGADLANKVK